MRSYCIRNQESFLQFEFILLPQKLLLFQIYMLKIISTIKNKRNKNLLLREYIYITIKLFYDSKGTYKNYGDDLAIIL